MAEQFVVKNGFISRERSTFYGDIFTPNLPATQSGAPATTYLGYLTASDEIIAVNDPRVTIDNAGYGRIVQASGSGNTKNLYASSYNYLVSGSTAESYTGYLGQPQLNNFGVLTFVNGDYNNGGSSNLLLNANRNVISNYNFYCPVGSQIVYAINDTGAGTYGVKIDYIYCNNTRSKLQTGTLRASFDAGQPAASTDVSVTAIGFNKFFPFSWSESSGTFSLSFTNGGTNTDTLYLTMKITVFQVAIS
jgi:hypothetical protein